jgi:hypothetical protein
MTLDNRKDYLFYAAFNLLRLLNKYVMNGFILSSGKFFFFEFGCWPGTLFNFNDCNEFYKFLRYNAY